MNIDEINKISENYEKSYVTTYRNTFSQVLDKKIKKVHIFGDSHCLIYSSHCIGKNNILYNVEVHHLGPRTMYRIGRDKLKIINLKNLSAEVQNIDDKSNNKVPIVNEKDVVIYIFGEIDIRCHLLKQIENSNSNEDEIIDKLVTEYINAVKVNHSLFKNITSCIRFITPACQVKSTSSKRPIYGSLSERIKLTKKINKYLQLKCGMNNIIYINDNIIHTKFTNKEGVLKKEFIEAGTHFNTKCLKFLEKQLLDIL